MSKRSMTLTEAVAALALLVLPGCGGSNPSTPTPVPTPTPRPTPVTVTLRQGTLTGLEPNFLLSVPFVVTAIGDVDAMADWTFAANNLDLILTRGTNACRNADSRVDFRICTVVASEFGTSKPERLRIGALGTGDYTLYIGNAGPGRESLSYQVSLTYTPSAAGPGAGLSTVRDHAGEPQALRAAHDWR